MKILLYNELNSNKIPNFKKISTYLETDNFKAAEVKKVGDNLYRSRLNKNDRLLFALHHYQGETYILILECILNHAYEKSRFLHENAVINDAKIPVIESAKNEEIKPLSYVNTDNFTFHILDKILSLDDIQNNVYQFQTPLIIIGSAGSGKTVLTLEKMKQSVGEILYVTRSPYLVHNSRNLYYAMNYQNEDQEIAFLSFDDYLASIRVPQGKEMPVSEFTAWFVRQSSSKKLKDAHQLLEEFKGVITGPHVAVPYLNREEYLNLGIKQSIFSKEERTIVYDLFERYLAYLQEKGYYDTNILSYTYLQKVEPCYDFIVVDEVQDLTNIQLQVILKALRDPTEFILCGDSNQIVHPNFFSWSHIKTFFYQQESKKTTPTELIRVLNTNYRNSPQITKVANDILKIKNARFGSIDRESNYLVHSNVQIEGRVALLPKEDKSLEQLNKKSRLSTRFAVIVMHPGQKNEAKQIFSTPLIFSVQEAKGLEYENIILYNFVSGDEKRFREICKDVVSDDLHVEQLTYSRAKDKSDKSLEIFKFYVNALYVAVTRAVCNLYIIETNTTQRLFDLLALKKVVDDLDNLQSQDSSLEEWRKEAHKLEMQGKQEQAEEIRRQILKQESVPWEVITNETLETLRHLAIDENNKKAKITLFEYAVVYRKQALVNQLAEAKFNSAHNLLVSSENTTHTLKKALKQLNTKYYLPYDLKHTTGVTRQIEKYGVDFRNPFNQTPLMIATYMGRADLIEMLMEEGANTELVNNLGLNSFQIALERAISVPKFTHSKLASVYQYLEPDNTTIQVNERLISLDNHLMEFFMLNLMIVMCYTHSNYRQGLTSGDFVAVLENFPEHIMPKRRKKRTYISSILSKNEINRDDRYNRKLFLRVKRGCYIINPELSIRIEGTWQNTPQ
ncbi:UvrD-helicase domain-containing protein [Candidatus Parabeggiatoa sp. HSG14]|uniref:UvrD-helicase domain-containing protein n=1 Tax=Candidatus Parabeggiatoa sp. HSG14 TaxID=3055593 RepID=UPI0025A8442C|nr:UvrD-helicase domain-containing protein [Thiotrichales bacterium HSG14]